MRPVVSVLMPTYDQARFLPRAVQALLDQELAEWELVIVDDGSPDDTEAAVKPFLGDPRVRYERLPENRGTGAALNRGLDLTTAPLVAYLPSDDVVYAEHLATLAGCFADPDVVLAHSGVRHHYNRFASGAVPGRPLQLVQVMHRRTGDRWTERPEMVSDDLDRLLWARLRARGRTAGTGRVSCEWVDHPDQGHKLLQEPDGGINPYRSRFSVPHPLRFHTTVGNPIDEVALYARFRDGPDTPPAPDGLGVVLAGELAYNPERVLALEERGHRLHGLWTPDPMWFNTVGPLPFGHVADLPRHGWEQALGEVGADLIYGLLNWQAVPFAHHVVSARTGLPFVWHFKEGPFICLEKGIWTELVELYERADAVVWSSPEQRDWFATACPSLAGDPKPSIVLDGDLPKREWLDGERSARLSDGDGEVHTVVTGRPIGLHPPDVGALAAEGIHLHFYGDFTHGQWRQWIDDAGALAPGRLHLHGQVDQRGWVRELSQYDAGWLHCFESRNGGDIRRATFDDINRPARLATYALAGLPVVQRDNSGSVVAAQSTARDLGIGVFFRSYEELGARLRDERAMAALRHTAWRRRHELTFDHHADRLVELFRTVVG